MTATSPFAAPAAAHPAGVQLCSWYPDRRSSGCAGPPAQAHKASWLGTAPTERRTRRKETRCPRKHRVTCHEPGCAGSDRGGGAERRPSRGQPVARGRPARRSRPACLLAAGAGRAAGRPGRGRPAGPGRRRRPGAAFPLTLADLPGLLALPALVAGVARLRPRARDGPAPAGPAPPGPGRRRAGPSAPTVTCWLARCSSSAGSPCSAPAYAHSGDDPGTFAGELVHPLADLLVLGGLLPLAVAAGRRGVAPVPRAARAHA